MLILQITVGVALGIVLGGLILTFVLERSSFGMIAEAAFGLLVIALVTSAPFIMLFLFYNESWKTWPYINILTGLYGLLLLLPLLGSLSILADYVKKSDWKAPLAALVAIAIGSSSFWLLNQAISL